MLQPIWDIDNTTWCLTFWSPTDAKEMASAERGSNICIYLYARINKQIHKPTNQTSTSHCLICCGSFAAGRHLVVDPLALFDIVKGPRVSAIVVVMMSLEKRAGVQQAYSWAGQTCSRRRSRFCVDIPYEADRGQPLQCPLTEQVCWLETPSC